MPAAEQFVLLEDTKQWWEGILTKKTVPFLSPDLMTNILSTALFLSVE